MTSDLALTDLLALCATRLRESADHVPHKYPEMPGKLLHAYADQMELWAREIKRRMRTMRTEISDVEWLATAPAGRVRHAWTQPHKDGRYWPACHRLYSERREMLFEAEQSPRCKYCIEVLK